MEAAFFDLDKTIVARSSPLALGPSFFRSGLIGGTLLLKSLYAQLVFHLWGAGEDKMERMRNEAARMTAGWDQERVREVVSEVLEEVISPLIFSEALELIFDHREAGRLICIVSSSPAEIVEPLAGMLQVDHYISTRAAVKDGKYTGELDFYCYGPAKVEAIEELAAERGIDLEGSFAYSDSVTDLPMLEAVGNPVVVNPDKELRAIATERAWEVLWFRNPVTLRDRLPQIRMPDLKVPEWKRPDWRVPDWRVPEWRVPEWRVPEWRVPEWRVPEWRVSDWHAPESIPPEVIARAVAVGFLLGAAWWWARRSPRRSLLARLL